MMTLVIIQLVAQLFLNTSISQLFGLFFTLQVVCYLSFYRVTLPSNSQIYRDQVTSLIEFDVLNPEAIVRIFDPEFDVLKWIKGDEDLQIVDADMANSMLNDLKIYIFASLAMTLSLIIMVIFKRSARLRASADRLLKQLRRKFQYNGLINSMNIAYMEALLTAATQLRLWLISSEFQEDGDKYSAAALGLVLLAAPVASAVWL